MTLCKNGLHDITLPNALIPKHRPSGGHQCRECKRLSNSKYDASPKRQIVRDRYNRSIARFMSNIRSHANERLRALEGM